MRKAYKKLTYADRQTIEHMTEQGAEPKKIAEVTGVHVATIYREVVYMTTQPKTDLPTHFITSSALRTSTVLCEQISSVYEERIGEWIGTLTPEEMKQLDECLTVSVGINTKAEKEPAEMESLRQQLAEMADRQQVAEKQAKTYKEMYEFLLSKQLGTKGK